MLGGFASWDEDKNCFDCKDAYAVFKMLKSPRSWEEWEDEHGTSRRWKRRCGTCELKHRKENDFERFWRDNDLPIETKTEWAWVKGNDADAPAPPASSENVGKAGWKAFEALKIEWFVREDHDRMTFLDRGYFTEKMVSKDIRSQTRTQGWMKDGDVIKKAKIEYQGSKCGINGLVLVNKAFIDGLQKAGTEDGSRAQEIPEDLRRSLRPIEDMCPLITAEDIEIQGVKICLKLHQAKEQFVMDDEWCDTRMCRMCNCFGKDKFVNLEHEQRHRASKEHKLALKNYSTEHLRCLLCNLDAWKKMKYKSGMDTTVAVGCQVGSRVIKAVMTIKARATVYGLV